MSDGGHTPVGSESHRATGSRERYVFLVAGQPFPGQRIEVRAATKLAKIIATCPAHYGQVTVKRLPLDDMKWELDLNLSASIPAGPFAFDITLVPFSASATRLPPVSVPVQGTVWAQVEAVPPRIHFGARTLGESRQESIRLYSPTLSAVRILHYRVDSLDLDVRLSRQEESGDAYLILQQRIAKLGPQSVNIIVNAQTDGGETELRVPVDYHGLPALNR